MLLDNGSILVEPRAATVSFLISFEDVGATIDDTDVYADYIVAEKDLSPPTSIAPFLLATLNYAQTVFVAILLYLQSALSNKVPDVEWTEGVAMLKYQPRPLNSFLQCKQVWRVIFSDGGNDGLWIVGQVNKLLVNWPDWMLIDHHVVDTPQQSLINRILRHYSEVLVLDEA